MKNKMGYFQAANGGTLFLDEIGDLPNHLQAKLLRVLQEKQITPVGSTETKKIDFRLIAATNVDLEQAVLDGKFREDLYFRLKVLPINIPPLRDRPEDVATLAIYFLNKENIETNQNKNLLASSVDVLKKMKWKGNVRELEHTIKHLIAMSSGDSLDVEILLKDKKLNRLNGEGPKTLDVFKSHVQIDEKSLVKKALEVGGNVSAASRILNVSRPTLRAKMKKYQLFFEKITKGEV
jgi:transcriptional regulator with PAS, ATPase and Fis domain